MSLEDLRNQRLSKFYDNSQSALMRKNRLRNSNLGIDTQRELEFEAQKEAQFPGSRAKVASTLLGIASLPVGGNLARVAPKIAPYLNPLGAGKKSAALQTGLTAISAPEVGRLFTEGGENLDKGNYMGALSDYSLGVGSLFMGPLAVRQAGQATRFLNKPLGRQIYKTGKNLGKAVTKEGTLTKTKGATVLGSALTGEMLEDPAFASSDIKTIEDNVKKDTTTTTTNNNKDEDLFEKAVVGGDILEELIPEVKSVEDKIMGGFKGPSGPLGGELDKLTDDNIDKEASIVNVDEIMGGLKGPSGPLGDPLKESVTEKDLAGDVDKITGDKVFVSKLTTNYLYNKMQSGPPSTFNAINQKIQENFKSTDAKIQELRNMLSKEKLQSFDEYRDEFRKNSGYDGNEKMMDYIMLEMGLGLLSGRSYETGVSGFLDIFGQVGANAAAKGMELLKSEQELNQGLALKYNDYEEKFNKYLTDQEKEILNAEITNLQSRDTMQIDAMNKRADSEFTIDKLWFDALSRDDAAKGGPDLENKIFNIQIVDPNAFMGTVVKTAQRQKGTGEVYVREPVTNKMIPINTFAKNMGITSSFSETPIDSVALRKAKAQANYSHAGVIIVDNVIKLATDLPLGSEAVEVDFISTLVGYEKLVTNLFGFGGADSTTFVENDYRNSLKRFNSEDDSQGGVNINDLIIGNTVRADGSVDYEERKALITKYETEKRDIMENYGKRDFSKTGGDNEISILETLYKDRYSGPVVDKNGKAIPEEVKKEKVRQALAAYKVYENKLKYIVANSNKAEDRLTRADVNDAENQVRIFEFKDGEIILEKYKLVKSILNRTFENKVEIMRENGYHDENYFFNKYGNMNVIKKYKNKLKNLEIENQNKNLLSQSSQQEVLSGIGK